MRNGEVTPPTGERRKCTLTWIKTTHFLQVWKFKTTTQQHSSQKYGYFIFTGFNVDKLQIETDFFFPFYIFLRAFWKENNIFDEIIKFFVFIF